MCIATVGCASDGQTLRAPSPEQTTTTRPPAVTLPEDILESDSGLRITGTDFEPGGMLPVNASCSGAGASPELVWTELDPADGAEIAISLTDQTDIDTPLLLWLVTGIPTEATKLSSGAIPPEAVETLNDYGESGYGSPCIARTSDPAKQLQFRIHVLSAPSQIEANAPGNVALETVRSLTVDQAAVLINVGSDDAAAAVEPPSE